MAEFVLQEASKHPDLEVEYSEFANLYSRRLWHQLTQVLLEFVFNDGNFWDKNMIELYENFICKFEQHMNQTSFARIVCRISRQYVDNLIDTIQFLEKVSSKRERLGDSAWLIIQLEIAHVHLVGKLPKMCNEILEQATKMLAENTYPETSLYAQYYRVSLQYYKVIGNADKYLDSALKFLEHTMQQDIENANNNDGTSIVSEYNLPMKEKYLLASDICLAAILSRKCYNFSPLLEHRLIHCLKDTSEYQWLWTIINLFNHGSMMQWKDYTIKKGNFLKNKNEIKTQLAFLEQKIRLMALIELVFKTHAHERVISFETIAKYCELEIDEVELVLMRAFSLELVKGTIDEINQTTNITYVVPRTLNSSQINELKSKSERWCNNIGQIIKDIETEVKEKIKS